MGRPRTLPDVTGDCGIQTEVFLPTHESKGLGCDLVRLLQFLPRSSEIARDPRHGGHWTASPISRDANTSPATRRTAASTVKQFVNDLQLIAIGQNARVAGATLGSRSGSLNGQNYGFARVARPDGFRSGVSEVQASFVTSLATMHGNDDDGALQLDRRCLQSQSWASTANWRREWDTRPVMGKFSSLMGKFRLLQSRGRTGVRCVQTEAFRWSPLFSGQSGSCGRLMVYFRSRGPA